MLNRWQAPVAARSLRETTPPVIARGARHLKQSLFRKDQMIHEPYNNASRSATFQTKN